MSAPHHRSRAAGLVVLALLLSAPAAALAQTDEPRNVALDRWQPGLDLESIAGVNVGMLPLADSFDVWAATGYAGDLLLVTDATDTTRALLAHRWFGHLGGSMTVLPSVQVGLDLPVALYQGRGGSPTTALGALDDLSPAGMGDLSVTGKIGLLAADEALVDVALLAGMTAPTHLPREAYLGQSNVTATAAGAASRELGDLRLAANLAYHWRPSVRFLDAKIGPELRLGVGAAYDLETLTALPLEAAVAWQTAMRADAPLHRANESPSELLVEATYLEWLPFAINAGVGVGVVAGVGTPSVRVFVGGRYVRRPGDRDGDRIPDQIDACPDEKEDIDDYEDADGCPDLDNDEDGIPDDEDACPDVPESVNEFEDSDGCPEEMLAVLESGRIDLSESVLFESGKAILKPRSKKLLKQVADLLDKNPQLKVIRVEGHTDAQGSEADNQILSQARCEAVKRFLIGRGVDGGRLKARGFGESRPVATNKTARGRAKNRRVEFIIEELEEPAPE